MTPRDVFGIIVRTIGLLLLITWIWVLIPSIASRSGYGIFLSFVLCTIGGYLLKGSRLVMELAYPTKTKLPGATGGPSSNAPDASR